MRTVILAVGSYGDVAPYTGLAKAIGAAGHSVAIATHRVYETAVTSVGLEFLPLPMDPRQVLAGDSGRAAAGTSPRALRSSITMIAEHQRDLGQGMLAASAGAEVLLLSPMAWLGWHIAQGLGIPSAGAYLQPWTPTAEFPPAAMTTRSLGRWGNRLAARMLRTAGQRPARHVIDDLRAELGLSALSPAASFAEMEATRWPVFYGYSPRVVPVPRDWPEWHRAVGYWWPEVDPAWTPSPELVDFLDAGPAPVFVGFGSMTIGDPDRLATTVSSAVRVAGVRAVVQAGADLGMSDDILSIGAVPHSWLFPRTSAVVHHCGAGTAAAGLRAGIATVPVPMMVDQPFWARRLHGLGVATAPLPFDRLVASSLAERVTEAVTDTAMGARARSLAESVKTEEGAAPVIEWVSRQS